MASTHGNREYSLAGRAFYVPAVGGASVWFILFVSFGGRLIDMVFQGNAKHTSYSKGLGLF